MDGNRREVLFDQERGKSHAALDGFDKDNDLKREDSMVNFLSSNLSYAVANLAPG